MKTKIRLQGITNYWTNGKRKPRNVEFIDTNMLPCWADDYDSDEFVYHSPTLKDVAIILYQYVGMGVQWQLARELSKRTGFDLKIINKELEKIVQEYAVMSDEDAIKLWNSKESEFVEEVS
jgi:hypothetical protein